MVEMQMFFQTIPFFRGVFVYVLNNKMFVKTTYCIYCVLNNCINKEKCQIYFAYMIKLFIFDGVL